LVWFFLFFLVLVLFFLPPIIFFSSSLCKCLLYAVSACPSIAAFTAALGAGGFANSATAAQVTKVLQYHVTTAGNVRSSQLTNNQVVPMITSPVQNVTVILGTSNPVTVDIKDTQNILSRVFQADIQASNGVIHGVNKVLRPF
jgi:uncharacterized surface protein with fasciclin (FAS1) repeats